MSLRDDARPMSQRGWDVTGDRDFIDDLDAMNEVSTSIIGEPIGVALAPTNPAREANGRLIQDARMLQLTDPMLREQLLRVARSSLGATTVQQHRSLLEEALTNAALVGASVEAGRIVESMSDRRFCQWAAAQGV